MALYQVRLYKNNQEVFERDCRGSCTGAFQGVGFGYFGNKDYDTMTVQIGCCQELSDGFLKKMSETPLMQALVPGLELIEAGVYLRDYGCKKVTWKFPGCDVVPADQAICAMRIINSFGSGYYNDAIRRLREYELTTSEMMVIAMFGGSHPRSSDSQPSLYYLEKSFAKTDPEFTTASRHIKIDIFEGNKKRPYASMLLPLIRGEINPGWQLNLCKGYMKETSVVGYMAGNPYTVDAWWDACPDDAFLTVNHPLIHPSSEGPVLDMNTRVEDVADWVLQQLGK